MEKSMKFYKLLIFAVLTIGYICSGCSWQGQKAYHDGKVISEWWSMRCLWVSNGIEAYTQTPYYTSGAAVTKSANDPNSVTAATELLRMLERITTP